METQFQEEEEEASAAAEKMLISALSCALEICSCEFFELCLWPMIKF